MEEPMKKYGPLCLIYGLPALVVVMLLWSTYREVRQQKGNQALIAAIKRIDVKTVTILLDQGVDANTWETEQPHSLSFSAWKQAGGPLTH